jgi:predicted nucleotidyltransferase component of viral defense system
LSRGSDPFNAPSLQGKIAFRGGTAINKLLFKTPLRYSEDIDLVQISAEPIGDTVEAIREVLHWLGKCAREQAGHSMHLVFRFAPEVAPDTSLKVKVEINTREHEPLFDVRHYPFAVENDWYTADASIVSFEPEELFGTKLRALLQRRKNRDLFDLQEGLKELSLDRAKLISAFEHYIAMEGKPITRAIAEQRMLEKLTRSLTEDIAPLDCQLACRSRNRMRSRPSRPSGPNFCRCCAERPGNSRLGLLRNCERRPIQACWNSCSICNTLCTLQYSISH